VTTARQVRKLVEPLMERHPDLVLVGTIIFVKPLHHIMRGIVIDRTSSADIFNPTWAMYHSFSKLDYFPIGFGERLYRPPPALWRLSDPDIAQALIDVVERDALPLLRGVRTLQDYLDLLLPKDPAHLWSYQGVRLLFGIALGDLDLARDMLAETPPKNGVDWLNGYRDGLGSRLLELGARLSADDRAELATLLHEREAYTMGKLKVGHIWERTPFPLELESGMRKSG